MNPSDLILPVVLGLTAVLIVEVTNYVRWKLDERRLDKMRAETDANRGRQHK